MDETARKGYGSAASGKAIRVEIKKLVNDAHTPKLEREGDAGYDLYSNEETVLRPLERKLIGTGISVALPKGYEAQVRPKSGLAVEHGISILNTPGTIDAGYRGEIKIIAINLGQKEYKIEKGRKICQLVFNKIEHPEFREAKELDGTKRGKGGFGSTGLD